MQTADLWITGSGIEGLRSNGAPRARGAARTPSDLARRMGARSMHFDLVEQDRGAWGWALRNAYGEEVARSHVGYPSRVQASAAAVAFSRLVSEAGRQVGGR